MNLNIGLDIHIHTHNPDKLESQFGIDEEDQFQSKSWAAILVLFRSSNVSARTSTRSPCPLMTDARPPSSAARYSAECYETGEVVEIWIKVSNNNDQTIDGVNRAQE